MTQLSSPKTYDAVVIGGGPAGTQCALWLKMLGYTPIILEKNTMLGGQTLINPYPDAWNVAYKTLTGYEMAEQIHLNIQNEQIATCFNVRDIAISEHEKGFDLSFTADGKPRSLQSGYLVVATGVAANDGGIKSAHDIIIGPGKVIEATNFHDKYVFILGGGDNAFENYLKIKAKGAKSVKIFARHVRAMRKFIEKVPTENLYVGEYEVDDAHKTVNGKACDLICVMYGWKPAFKLPDNLKVLIDSKGFIEVDEQCKTSHPRIFAIGESTRRQHPCVTNAMSDGIVASKAIQKLLALIV